MESRRGIECAAARRDKSEHKGKGGGADHGYFEDCSSLLWPLRQTGETVES